MHQPFTHGRGVAQLGFAQAHAGAAFAHDHARNFAAVGRLSRDAHLLSRVFGVQPLFVIAYNQDALAQRGRLA
jgi:hypothetical protein